jgi:hypothetical protein
MCFEILGHGSGDRIELEILGIRRCADKREKITFKSSR